MSCSWAGFLRATGYSPKYMEFLLPLAWTSFVLKTTCERSSRSNDTLFKKKLVQKQSCFGWARFHFTWTTLWELAFPKSHNGCLCSIRYDPSDPDHRSRSHSVYTAVSGEERVGNFFDIILPKVSCLISFLKSMLFKKPFNYRIPKFRRWRNSECLIARSQILQLIYKLLVVLFGVTVETSWLQGGKTLIPVRAISQFFV